MSNIKEYIDMLGFKVKDKVTGLAGTVTSVSFDLYGCIQLIINPGLKEDGTQKDSIWLDYNRVKITSKTRVMPVPNFEEGYQAEAKQGAAEKPISNKF